MKIVTLLFIVFSLPVICTSQSLKPAFAHWLKTSEPSDLCATNTAGEYVMLSEKGSVYIINDKGDILRESPFHGFDLEAVCTDGTNYLVSEESFQQIHVLDGRTLELIRTVPMRHGGGRNEGVEAMVYLPETGHFLLSTEKDPQFFMELDKDLRILQTFTIAGIKEVSALSIINKDLYVLSDENHSLYRVNLTARKIESTYDIPVINPEGLCELPEGKMMIVSDDMAKIFHFQIPAAQ